jgi:hypothetical protein
VLGSLLLGVFLRQVSSHQAAANGPCDRVMPSVVARDTANDRAFEAASGVRRPDCRQRQRCGGQRKLAPSFHSEVPICCVSRMLWSFD